MALTREITELRSIAPIRYSICTLVNHPQEYESLQESFRTAGFHGESCEFLYADNCESNQYDAFQAINLFLQEAAGDYIILCHQDVRLHDHRIEDLERAITEISEQDPHWGVLGNAGGISPGRLAIRITDPKGVDTTQGPFPSRVDAIDENFMVVRRDANLCLSKDLAGFHFYGTDLCIIADILGYRSYVIDFHLHHIGGESTKKGISKNSFHSSYPQIREALVRKYQRAFRPRWIQNTGSILHLSGSRSMQLLFNARSAVNLRKTIGKTWAKVTQWAMAKLRIGKQSQM